MCQVTNSPAGQSGFVLAVWEPAVSPVVWQYLGDGAVSGILQDGQGCGPGFSTNRLTNLTFVCNTTASTPVLLSAVEGPACTYLVLIETDLVCGAAFRGSSSSMLGDPQFVGLRGQSYQVHGIDGAVYNLISDAAVQLNARFTYLSGGECPRDATTHTPLFTCWTHPGSYLSELALRTSGGEYVRLVAGKAQQGFAVVELGSTDSSNTSRRVLSVGDTATLSVLDEASAATTATVSYDGLRSVRLSHAGLYSLVVENSDGFLNLLSLSVRSMHALSTRVHSHGLIGQTWRAAAEVKGSEVREVEGYVDDYAEAGADMLGCDFVSNKHKC